MSIIYPFPASQNGEAAIASLNHQIFIALDLRLCGAFAILREIEIVNDWGDLFLTK